MIVIGCDPGLLGGWAVLGENGSAAAYPFPRTAEGIDLAALADDWRSFGPETLACVEKVHAMPKQGTVSCFTFGKGYGSLLGILAANRVRVELVTPPAWKRLVLAGSPHDKESAIAYCRRAFPGVPLVRPGCRVAHDGMADALCIAQYAVRTYSNSDAGRA